MRMFTKVMEKWEFAALMAQILEGNCRPGHENKELQLKLSDFRNWDDWFGFGEWDDGAHLIRCAVADDNKRGIEFLKGNGFDK